MISWLSLTSPKLNQYLHNLTSKPILIRMSKENLQTLYLSWKCFVFPSWNCPTRSFFCVFFIAFSSRQMSTPMPRKTIFEFSAQNFRSIVFPTCQGHFQRENCAFIYMLHVLWKGSGCQWSHPKTYHQHVFWGWLMLTCLWFSSIF